MTARRRRTAARGTLGALALGLTLFGAGGGAVFAAGAPGDLSGLPATTAPEPAPPGDATTPEVTPPPVDSPAAPAAAPASPEPAAENPPPAQPNPPGNLFPDDGSPPPDVTNISLTGEAYVVRQDFKSPLELHLGRYPRATAEVSKDLTTAFGAFADPGFLGRFAVAEGAKSAGDRSVSAPAWAECVFPQSPLTPTEDVRGPGQGVGATAAAKCFQGAAQAAGYFMADTDADSGSGVEVISPGAALSTVDAASNAVGATFTQSVSTLEDITLAGRVTIKSLTNAVTVRTNGRPGGAVVETSATIGGISIENVPVALPSDSLAQAGPVLAQLPPVLSPLGVLTFDVVPEQKEAAADGTSATGRAAQLLVTLQNGEGTVSFGVGFASARGRTILNEFALPGTGATNRPPLREVRTIPGPQTPLRYGSGPTAADFVNSVGSSLGYRAPARSTGGSSSGGFPAGGFGAGGFGGLPTTGLNLLPPNPNQAQSQNTGETEAYGGDGPWLALIGGSVIGLALARYLAFSMAVRPTPT
ncbi:MAG TPA: hypothetical protein VGL92_18500 [Acidimicrobiia bacterium]|jgi:hypothetical protein